jgi:hydroxymethylbilane synthase
MAATSDRVTIGSRGSELALWQAGWVQKALERRFSHLDVPIQIIKTKGDKVLDSPLSKIGDKGLFTREIELALLSGDIDIAVHSLKDLPTELPRGLTIGATCEREDVRDVFIPHPKNPIRTLLDQPKGARIATGSLRRKCQLLHARSDFQIIDIRGNLTTRLKKLDESDWAGMMLARAGVVRLGWEGRVGETLDADKILPAVGQGALGIEIREDDERVADVVARA